MVVVHVHTIALSAVSITYKAIETSSHRLTVYVLRLPSRRKDDDERPLTEEAEGGCGDEIKTTDSCPEKLSTHMAEKAPLSYINIAFGQESDEEDEGEGEGEMGGEKDTDLSGGADAKLSPQR